MTPQTPDEIALPELPKGHYVRAIGEMYNLNEMQAYAREHEKNVRAALASRAVTDERAAFEALLDNYADAVNDEAVAYERDQTSGFDRMDARAAVLAAFDAARQSEDARDAAR
jgi:hypothetical protein